MAVRCLRSKLSERIFTHVDAQIMPHRLVKSPPALASEGTKIAPLARHSTIGSTMPIKNMMFQSFKSKLQDARIMPHHLVKGLPPLASKGTKIAPLARHSAIGSTMPIKNLTFQSFKSKVPESMPFGFLPNAKNVLLYNEAGYSLPSSFKGKSSPILIHGRNFSSCPPGTKNIPKMDSGYNYKGSSTPGTDEKICLKVDRSMSRRELLQKIIKVYGVVFFSIYFAGFYYTAWDTLCSSPFLFFTTVGGHIFCFLLMLLALFG